MNDDGTMARLPELVSYAKRHRLKIGTISDLIAYRLRNDSLVREVAQRSVTSIHGGDWQMRVFSDVTQGAEHIVLTMGDIATPEPVLVRMHSLNPLEDVLGLHPAHAGQMPAAMKVIAAAGRGVVVMLRDTSMRLALDEEAAPHKLRQYGLGAQLLAALGLHKIELVTNSGQPKIVGLDAYGLEIIGTRPIAKE
jgi:3,4-dihydroxy 2-butanone 4-phosphate synthase/GTP cyclohydrolase II